MLLGKFRGLLWLFAFLQEKSMHAKGQLCKTGMMSRDSKNINR